MKKYVILSILFSFFIFSCEKDDKNETVLTLQDYIETHPTFTPFNELVACAAGGQENFLENTDFPLSIFFYPELGATDFKYYETENISDDPGDLNLYIEKDASHEPLLNGFLRKFALPLPEKDVWARVSFMANDTLWFCKPIRLKYNSKPSQFAPELCQINLDAPQEPIFTWEDGIADDNIIYFQIISTENDDALSGTYTTDLFFQYYHLHNVVFNVTRSGQAMPLQIGETYRFTLMGVSADNWVNLIMQKTFTAQ